MADTHLNKLLDAAVEIRQSPDAVERAYMARQLVQCTLPHSDPVNMPSLETDERQPHPRY